MKLISFRILNASDSLEIYKLLSINTHEYLQYFHPFDFCVSSIYAEINNAKKDIYIGIDLHLNKTIDLIGFYMLRGLDAGYEVPMYGIFVSQKYSRKGVARLSLSHAECLCKFHGHSKILLKVNRDNTNARRLYESQGFTFLKEDFKINNLVLVKNLI